VSRVGAAALREQPSWAPAPVGILPRLRSGDAQPRSLFAMDGSVARDALQSALVMKKPRVMRGFFVGP